MEKREVLVGAWEGEGGLIIQWQHYTAAICGSGQFCVDVAVIIQINTYTSFIKSECMQTLVRLLCRSISNAL